MNYLSDQNLEEITIGLIIKYYTKDNIAFAFSVPVKEIVEPCYRYSTLIGNEKQMTMQLVPKSGECELLLDTKDTIFKLGYYKDYDAKISSSISSLTTINDFTINNFNI